MLKKSLLCMSKEFKVSIGAQNSCSASVNKTHAMPGEIITVAVHAHTGHGNTTVSVSPSVHVNKVNESTFTFVMPYQDVVVNASASVLEFSITVNQSGGGTVSVKPMARFGETVQITVSPAGGHRLQSISMPGVHVSGSGNNYSFVMPANNVTLHVAFEDMRVILTCGRVVGESGLPGYVNHQGDHAGSLNRVPYWESRDKFLSQFFARWDWHTLIHLGAQQNDTLECSFKTIYVNGQPFTLSGGGNTSRVYLNDGNNNLGLHDGKVITLTFNPPLRDSFNGVTQAFVRSRREGVVNAEEGNADNACDENRETPSCWCIIRRGCASLFNNGNQILLWVWDLGIPKRSSTRCAIYQRYHNPKYGYRSKDGGLGSCGYIQRCLSRIRSSVVIHKEVSYVA